MLSSTVTCKAWAAWEFDKWYSVTYWSSDTHGSCRDRSCDVLYVRYLVNALYLQWRAILRTYCINLVCCKRLLMKQRVIFIVSETLNPWGVDVCLYLIMSPVRHVSFFLSELQLKKSLTLWVYRITSHWRLSPVPTSHYLPSILRDTVSYF